MTTPLCTVLVPVTDRNQAPVSTAVVRTVPNGSGYIRIEDGAILEFGVDFYPVDPATGVATFTLPQGSYYSPPLSMIIIVPGPNGGSYAGIVPDAAGPFTLQNLLNGGGWAPVAQANSVVQTLAGITYNSRDVYAGGTVYHPFDVVSFSSALYQNILTTNGTQDPSNSTYWKLLLQSPVLTPATGPKITGTYPNLVIGAGTLVDADLASGANIAGSKIAPGSASVRGALFKSTYYLADYATLHDALTAIGNSPARLVIHQSMNVTAADAVALNGVVTATVASGGGLPAPSTSLGRGLFSTASNALVPGPMMVGSQLVMALEVTHLAAGIGSQITTAGYMTTLATVGDTITQQVVTIPTNVSLDFTNGAMFAPQSNVAFYPSGHIHNGPVQIFDLSQTGQSATQWSGAGCVKVNPYRCPEVLPEWFGARADADGSTAKNLTDGTIAGGSLSTLTSASGQFTSNDVGKPISVTGAGAGSSTLYTVVAGFTSSTSVTLALPASQGVSNATVVVGGTDSTTGLQAALIASAKGTGCDIKLAGGYYRVTSGVTVPNCGGYSGLVIKGRGNRRQNTAAAGTFIVWDGADFATDFNGGAINPANMGPLTFPTQASFAGLQWAIGTSYNQFELVQYHGKMYISRVGANLANQPDTATTQWAPFHVPLKLWTRNTTIEGIGIGVCNTKTVAGVLWIDQDPSSSTICTQIIAKQCSFGVNIDGRSNCHSIYNVIIGAFNQNNTDQHSFEDCDLPWTDWSAVHCANKTVQAKNIEFLRCNFTPRGDSTKSQYPTYFTSGSANYRVIYSNSYQYGYWHANTFEPITFYDCTGEVTNQFCHVNVTQGGSVKLVGCRISPAITNTTLNNGNELVWSNGNIELDSCNFEGSATNFSIRATDTVEAQGCIFPTLTPFFMGAGWQGKIDQRACKGLDADGSSQVMPDAIITSTHSQSATVNNAGGRTWQFAAQRSLTANDVAPAYASVFQPGTRNPAPPIVGPGTSTGGFLRHSFTYPYGVTFVTAAGESKASSTTGYVTTNVSPGTDTWAVALSQIPIGPPGTIARNIYRQSQSNAATTLAAAAAAGATSITVAAASNYQVGDPIVLTQGALTETVTLNGPPSGTTFNITGAGANNGLVNSYAGPTTLALPANVGDTSLTLNSAAGLANANVLTLTAPGSGAVFGTPVLSGGAVVSIPVVPPTGTGSGYSASNPPILSITGGGGIGASAVAIVDAVTHAITGFIITGGSGFTSAPTVALILSETVVVNGPPSGNQVNLVHAVTNAAGYPNGSTAVTVSTVKAAWSKVQPTNGATYTLADNTTTTYTDTGQFSAPLALLPGTDNTGLSTLTVGMTETDVVAGLSNSVVQVSLNGTTAYLSAPSVLPTVTGQVPFFDGTRILWGTPTFNITGTDGQQGNGFTGTYPAASTPGFFFSATDTGKLYVASGSGSGAVWTQIAGVSTGASLTSANVFTLENTFNANLHLGADLLYAGLLRSQNAAVPTIVAGDGGGLSASGVYTLGPGANIEGGRLQVAAGTTPNVNQPICTFQLPGYADVPRNVQLAWGSRNANGISGTLSFRNLLYSAGVASFQVFASTQLGAGSSYEFNYQIYPQAS